jgi:hypothetical protein
MPSLNTEVSESDTWLDRALARRQAEESGELEIQGARFNSSI